MLSDRPLEIHDIAEDNLAELFSFIGSEEKGWKSLMSLFLTNKFFYNLFLKDSVTRRVTINLNSTLFTYYGAIVSLDKINHVLMANFLLDSKPYPAMKALLQKNELISAEPALFNKENISLLTGKISDLQEMIKKTKAEELTSSTYKTTNKVCITSLCSIPIMAAFLKLMEQLSPSKPSELPILVALVLFFACAIYAARLENAHDKVKNKKILDLSVSIQEIIDTDKVMTHQHNTGLFKKNHDISLTKVDSHLKLNSLFRLNKFLKDPHNQDFDQVMSTPIKDELIERQVGCTIL